MENISVPEFIILGPRNEGKSTLVSTMTENDKIPLSSDPGETSNFQFFPVIVDGRDVIRFIDTPGLQNIQLIFSWMCAYKGNCKHILKDFIISHGNDPDFQEDCKIFEFMAGGAGIIYVADASRQLTDHDRAGMEILRLTGLFRMAVINLKDDNEFFLKQWKTDMLRNFNSIRRFNASRAARQIC